MPSPSVFRKGFHLCKHDTISLDSNRTLRIVSSSVGHDVVKKFVRYEFPTVLIVECSRDDGRQQKNASCSVSRVQQAIREHVGYREETLLSAYGNPYRCYFDVETHKIKVQKEDDNRYKIQCHGIAIREDKKKHKPKQRQTGMQHEMEEMENKGFRVIQSHFATSKCSICHQTIDVGELIAKSKQETRRGQWAHIHCAYNLSNHTKCRKRKHRPETDELSNPRKKRKSIRTST